MQWSDWLPQLNRLIKGEDATCPRCQSKDVEYRSVLVNEKTRVGYTVMWCNDCKKGVHLSRIVFDQDEKNLYSNEDVHLPDNIHYE